MDTTTQITFNTLYTFNRMNLTNLSPELILAIGEELPYQCIESQSKDGDDLKNFSLTNKTIRKVLLRLLFRSVRICLCDSCLQEASTYVTRHMIYARQLRLCFDGTDIHKLKRAPYTAFVWFRSIFIQGIVKPKQIHRICIDFLKVNEGISVFYAISAEQDILWASKCLFKILENFKPIHLSLLVHPSSTNNILQKLVGKSLRRCDIGLGLRELEFRSVVDCPIGMDTSTLEDNRYETIQDTCLANAELIGHLTLGNLTSLSLRNIDWFPFHRFLKEAGESLQILELEAFNGIISEGDLEVVDPISENFEGFPTPNLHKVTICHACISRKDERRLFHYLSHGNIAEMNLVDQSKTMRRDSISFIKGEGKLNIQCIDHYIPTSFRLDLLQQIVKVEERWKRLERVIIRQSIAQGKGYISESKTAFHVDILKSKGIKVLFDEHIQSGW